MWIMHYVGQMEICRGSVVAGHPTVAGLLTTATWRTSIMQFLFMITGIKNCIWSPMAFMNAIARLSILKENIFTYSPTNLSSLLTVIWTIHLSMQTPAALQLSL